MQGGEHIPYKPALMGRASKAPALSPGIFSGPCSAGHQVPCCWVVTNLGSLTWEYCTRDFDPEAQQKANED